MNVMNYKNYSARVEYSDEDGCFIGRIAGIGDIISFHGDSVKALRKAFKEAVEDYLDTCEKIGKNPQRPYSGKMLLRIDPSLHAKAAILAEARGKSLNSFMQETLLQAVG